jgi:hypothetical protein
MTLRSQVRHARRRMRRRCETRLASISRPAHHSAVNISARLGLLPLCQATLELRSGVRQAPMPLAVLSSLRRPARGAAHPHPACALGGLALRHAQPRATWMLPAPRRRSRSRALRLAAADLRCRAGHGRAWMAPRAAGSTWTRPTHRSAPAQHSPTAPRIVRTLNPSPTLNPTRQQLHAASSQTLLPPLQSPASSMQWLAMSTCSMCTGLRLRKCCSASRQLRRTAGAPGFV